MHGGAKGHASHEFGDVVSAHRDSVGLNARDRRIPNSIFVGFTHKTLSFHSLENFNHRIRQFTKRIDDRGAGFTQRFHFAGVRATTTFNNCSGVTKARAFARRLAADVCDHRLGDFPIANQLRQFLFL